MIFSDLSMIPSFQIVSMFLVMKCSEKNTERLMLISHQNKSRTTNLLSVEFYSDERRMRISIPKLLQSCLRRIYYFPAPSFTYVQLQLKQLFSLFLFSFFFICSQVAGLSLSYPPFNLNAFQLFLPTEYYAFDYYLQYISM